MRDDHENATKEQLARWLDAAHAEAKRYRTEKAYWKNYAIQLEKQLRNEVESNTAQ